MINPTELIKHAAMAQECAKAQYSNYPVGAALLTDTGEIIPGCNVESKAYPTTLCAERVAIFSAIAQGYDKFLAIAVITRDGGTPCGSCRQIIHEFAGNIPVIIGDGKGSLITFQMEELLPHPFG